MSIKKPRAILLAAVIVSCDYLPSARGRHVVHTHTRHLISLSIIFRAAGTKSFCIKEIESQTRGEVDLPSYLDPGDLVSICLLCQVSIGCLIIDKEPLSPPRLLPMRS